MKYRHEWKHEINYLDMLALRMRLGIVLKHDSHYGNKPYCIRSLYFDTPEDTALREKTDGVNNRDKYRIRYYNGDKKYIMLEKKSKRNGLCAKLGERITEDETANLIAGKIEWMKTDNRNLIRELYYKMKTDRLAPKTIVDYTREAFVFGPGNVRVTLDYHIRTGLSNTDFLNTKAVTVPIDENRIILEVKWDEYLPDIVRDTVFLPNRRASAFSKYAACRIFD